MLFYMDGNFVPEDQATVSVLDYGFLYGDGGYDTVVVAEGAILDLDRHMQRLLRSAKALRIEIPVTESRLRELILETASRNEMHGTTDGLLKIMFTRGLGVVGGLEDEKRRAGTLKILARAIPFSESIYRGPIRVQHAVWSSFERTVPTTVDARIKALRYTTSKLALIEAEDQGADQAIFRDTNGFITEAAAANVFCVSEGRIFTPTVTGVLSGITRRRVIDVARERGYECIERNLTRYDLETADEAFVTGSMTCVAALGRIGGITLPVAPGPLTTTLRDAYVESAFANATPIPVLQR